MLLHLGCVRTYSLQYTADLLDRVAIQHNENFTPTYMECQIAIYELSKELYLNPPREMELNVKVIQGKAKISRCSKELQEAWKKLEKRIEVFQAAAERIK